MKYFYQSQDIAPIAVDVLVNGTVEIELLYSGYTTVTSSDDEVVTGSISGNTLTIQGATAQAEPETLTISGGNNPVIIYSVTVTSE